MESILLSKRLRAIAEMVDSTTGVADIGTDHALVPVYLAQKKRCNKIIASDVNIGPLSVAEKNVLRYGLETIIEIRHSDGLLSFDKGEIDCIVVSGMGGSLICKILTEGIDVVKGLSCMVLQPQEAVTEVRAWLYDNNWIINDEALVEEGSIIYEVIKAVPNKHCQGLLSTFARLTLPLEVGPVLFIRKDVLLSKHIADIVHENNEIVENMKKAATINNNKILEYELKNAELGGVIEALKR